MNIRTNRWDCNIE